jgi:CheY-like chemotaxis protein
MNRGKTLVVVDNKEHRTAICTQLRREGFKCYEAPNYSKAIQPISTYRDIGVVLLDLGLPDRNEIKIFDSPELLGLLGRLAVCLISASCQQIVLKQCIEYGAVDFLCKPVDTRLLSHSVNTLL